MARLGAITLVMTALLSGCAGSGRSGPELQVSSGGHSVAGRRVTACERKPAPCLPRTAFATHPRGAMLPVRGLGKVEVRLRRPARSVEAWGHLRGLFRPPPFPLPGGGQGRVWRVQLPAYVRPLDELGFAVRYRTGRSAAFIVRLQPRGARPPARIISTPWRLKRISAGGRKLLLGVASGTPYCNGLDGTRVRETPRSVEVAVYQRVLTGPHVACTEEAIVLQVEVRLHDPLDGRRLRHAPATQA